MSHDLIDDLFEWTDITLIPSFCETVNYSALECGAHGKIALASNVPGLNEVIENSITGYLLEPDAQCFYRKIIDLYNLKQNHVERFFEIGARARKYIDTKFNPKANYGEFRLMLEDIIRTRIS